MRIDDYMTDLNRLDPSNIKWWNFDPAVVPLISYHSLVKKALTQSLSTEKPFRDLLGRAVLIGTIPLGYSACALLAIIGVIFECITRNDFGYYIRRQVLEKAAIAGRQDIIEGVIKLNRHTNADLSFPLKEAGQRADHAMVKYLLQVFNINELINFDTRQSLDYPIGYLKSNALDPISRNLIEDRLKQWKLHHGVT